MRNYGKTIKPCLKIVEMKGAQELKKNKMKMNTKKGVKKIWEK
jgi:hypothetical protein